MRHLLEPPRSIIAKRAMRKLRQRVKARAERQADAVRYAVRRRTRGASQCAAGHLCDDPRARRAGLALIGIGGDYCPTYRDKAGFSALAAFLDITEKDSFWLFDPVEYNEEFPEKITPGEVIARVGSLMARGSR